MTTIDELKKLKIWVNYFYDGFDIFAPKSPVDPKEMRNASVSDPETWGDYELASSHIESHGAGVGVVFGELPNGNHLAGIDIDAHNTDHNPLAKEILERFSGTYAEYSPSGDGVHILGEVDIEVLLKAMGGKWDKDKYFWKNSELELECYIGGLTNRYFTFTGEAINDNPIVDITQPLLWFIEDYMRRPETPKTHPKTADEHPTPRTHLSIEDILTKARNAANGDKFSALYDRGDIGEYNNDDSAADMALCNMLAWWLGGDYNAIDEAFRQSALCRSKERIEKWARSDYPKMTINKAIELCGGNFYSHPPSPSTFNCSIASDLENTIPAFVITNNQGEPKAISPPQLAKTVRQLEHFAFIKNNSEKSDCLFYDNTKGVHHLIGKPLLLGEIKKYVEAFDENLVKSSDIEEVFRLLFTDRRRIDAEDINNDTDIINFRNGILKLSTMEFLPHDPKYLSTVQLDCNYNPEAGDCPIFDGFIQTLSNGDEEVMTLLCEYLGLAISNIPGYKTKRVLYLVGETDAGKSKYFELLSRLVGSENFSAISLKGLEERFGTYRLYGKRLAGCADLSVASVSELNVLKNITGGDPIHFEGKGKDVITAKYKGVMLFSSNELPEFGGDHGNAVFNRLLIVPCNNSIPLERQDKMLIEKLWNEREAIVAKCIPYLKDLIDRDCVLTEPKVCHDARAAYQAVVEPILTFIDEYTVPRDQADHAEITNLSSMYEAYNNFCTINNFKPHDSRRFKAILAQYKIVEVKIKNNRCYTIELTAAARLYLLPNR